MARKRRAAGLCLATVLDAFWRVNVRPPVPFHLYVCHWTAIVAGPSSRQGLPGRRAGLPGELWVASLVLCWLALLPVAAPGCSGARDLASVDAISVRWEKGVYLMVAWAGPVWVGLLVVV